MIYISPRRNHLSVGAFNIHGWLWSGGGDTTFSQGSIYHSRCRWSRLVQLPRALVKVFHLSIIALLFKSTRAIYCFSQGFQYRKCRNINKQPSMYTSNQCFQPFSTTVQLGRKTKKNGGHFFIYCCMFFIYCLIWFWPNLYFLKLN